MGASFAQFFAGKDNPTEDLRSAPANAFYYKTPIMKIGLVLFPIQDGWVFQKPLKLVLRKETPMTSFTWLDLMRMKEQIFFL